jgi:hypothetical protein
MELRFCSLCRPKALRPGQSALPWIRPTRAETLPTSLAAAQEGGVRERNVFIGVRVRLVLLTLLILAPSEGTATLFTSFTPQEAAARSGYVFAGTVSAVRSARVGGGIVTKVVFRDLEFGKGVAQTDSLLLSLAGGAVGNDLVVFDDQPTFEQGGRYIVFAIADLGSPRNSYLPVIGLGQGQFRVGPALVRGDGRVLDSQGLPVMAIRSDRITVILPDSLIPAAVRKQFDAKRWQELMAGTRQRGGISPRRIVLQQDDTGLRVTEREFLEAVRQFSR